MRALLAVVVLAGCTHTRPITEAHELVGEWVTVETYSHETTEVYVEQAYVEGATEGIAFRSATGGYVAISEIAKIVDKRVGRGGLEGFGLGFLGGAAVGAVIGYADGDDECDPNDGHWCLFTMTAGEKAVLGGAVFGVLGGALGGLIGLARGSHFEYSYGERVIPTGPPGSAAGMTIIF
jgi:hypothetical protein